MRRLLLLGLLAAAACHDSPVAPGGQHAAASVDPLSLVTVCRTDADPTTGPGRMTLAVSEAAAKQLTASGKAQSGPCPPTLLAPRYSEPIAQQYDPSWCPDYNRLGYEVAFSWEPARDPQKRVAKYEVRAQRPGIAEVIGGDTVAALSLIAHGCGGLVGAYQYGWTWKVRAVDQQGRWGPWSDTVAFHFGPIPETPIPVPLSPRSWSDFYNYPRTTTLTWTTVPNTSKYEVELGFCQDYPNFWDTLTCRSWGSLGSITSSTTSATFDFVGNQAGRWRVRAWGAQGPGAWSPYWYFIYHV